MLVVFFYFIFIFLYLEGQSKSKVTKSKVLHFVKAEYYLECISNQWPEWPMTFYWTGVALFSNDVGQGLICL